MREGGGCENTQTSTFGLLYIVRTLILSSLENKSGKIYRDILNITTTVVQLVIKTRLTVV